MLAISLTLHAISTLILITPNRTTLKGPTATFLDLNDIQAQSPAPVSAAPSPPMPEPVPDASRNDSTPPVGTASEAEKLQNDIKQSVDKAQTNPDSLHERSFGLGLTSGYFSSIAEGDSLKNDIRDYYFTMLREINEKWWLDNGGKFGSFRGALVEIVVAKDGMIVKKTLVRSSGNPSFDRAIFQTLDKANPLPPLPQEYKLNYFSAPLRFVAPLNLFAS